MNKRQKKKLKKRDGHFHYKDYKLWQQIWRIAEAKYGKYAVAEWIAKKQDSQGSNLINVTTTRKGCPIDVELYSNVFPVAYLQSDVPEKYQWKGPIMCCLKTPLNAACVNHEEYKEALEEYQKYFKRRAASACEAMGMEVD